MAEDLIKKLKSCSPDERVDLAVKAAEIDKKRTIEELKKIVNYKNPWNRVLRFKPYKLQDQLSAYKALGEIGDENTLDFLEGVFKYKEYERVIPGTQRWNVTTGELVWAFHKRTFIFPNARGPFRELSDHITEDNQIVYDATDAYINLKRSGLYYTIESTLSKLKKRLGVEHTQLHQRHMRLK